VSELLSGGMKELLADLGIDKNTINFWAIHPGGKKILDDFATAVEIDKALLSHSYDVLKNYGNMSSATVLFVLKQVIEANKKRQKGDTIFSAAFGPGLSIETMRLKYV
jgi:predicted naringenin-chalcone synthase